VKSFARSASQPTMVHPTVGDHPALSCSPWRRSCPSLGTWMVRSLGQAAQRVEAKRTGADRSIHFPIWASAERRWVTCFFSGPGFSRNRRCKAKGIRGRAGAGSKRQRTTAHWGSPPSAQTGGYRMPSLYAGGIASSASRLTELIPILHRSAFELKCSPHRGQYERSADPFEHVGNHAFLRSLLTPQQVLRRTGSA
jgi:hypothetical protein